MIMMMIVSMMAYKRYFYFHVMWNVSYMYKSRSYITHNKKNEILYKNLHRTKYEDNIKLKYST